MPKTALILASLLLAPPAIPAAIDPALTEASSLLRDGRFDAAERALRATPPYGSAARQFFLAFVTYWRLIYDEEDPPLRTEFESRLGEAIRPAEAKLGTDPTDPEALLWAGTSRLLLAQFRAEQDEPFAAAREAKRAKRLLEAASAAGGGASAEPLFGLKQTAAPHRTTREEELKRMKEDVAKKLKFQNSLDTATYKPAKAKDSKAKTTGKSAPALVKVGKFRDKKAAQAKVAELQKQGEKVSLKEGKDQEGVFYTSIGKNPPVPPQLPASPKTRRKAGGLNRRTRENKVISARLTRLT